MPDQAGIPLSFGVDSGGVTSPDNVGGSALNFRGGWDPYYGYSIGDAVFYNGQCYRCIQAIAPPVQTLHPLGGVTPQGLIASGIEVNGAVTTADPPEPAPTSGVGLHAPYCQIWEIPMSVSGNLQVVTTGLEFDGSDSAGNLFLQDFTPPTNQALGTFTTPRCYIIMGGKLGPKTGGYTLKVTNGTGTIGGVTTNPTPDTDTTHWSTSGV